MKNSRFTPRTNSFTKKVMAITTKVMIFGVLLSLFLYACIGADSLSEGVAYADSTTGTAAATYGNSGALTATNFAGGYPGTTIGGVWNHTESFSSKALSSSNVSAQTRKSIRDITISTRSGNNGFKFYKSDNENWGDSDGFQMYAVVNYQVSTFLLNLISNNTATVQVTGFTATFARSGGGSAGVKISSESALKNASSFADGAYSSFTTSTSTSWSVNTNPNITLTSNSKYIALAFMVQGTSSQDAKNVAGEVYNMNLKFKVTLKDSSAPTISVDNTNNKITVTDSTVGIKSIAIRREADGKNMVEYTAPTTWGGQHTEIISAEVTNVATNPSFSNDTKTFTCNLEEATTYRIVAKDHFGNTLNTTFTIKGKDLKLVDENSGLTYVIKEVVTGYGANLTVPEYILASGSNYVASDSANGININDVITREGYGIAGYTATTNATIVTNGVTATYQATTFADVTLTVTWEQLFMLKYYNNLSTVSTVTRYANTNTATSMDIIGSADQASLIQKTPTGAWSGFLNPAGYYLAGWEDRNNNITYDAYGDTVYNFAQYSNSDTIELYAVWLPIEFSIIYDVNGGSESIPTQTGLSVENIGAAQDGGNFDSIADNFFKNWLMAADSTYGLPAYTFNRGEHFTVDQLNTILSARRSNIADGSAQTMTLVAQWTGAMEFGKYADGTGQWGSETNPYVIRTQAHLNTLAGIVNGTTSTIKGSIQGYASAVYTNPVAVGKDYANAYFVLEVNNLSRSATIGSGTNAFAGNFDGKGNTISFTYSAEDSYIGVFAQIGAGGTVQNLNVTANISKSSYQAGGIAGRNYGTISNCKVSGTVKSTVSSNSANNVGGIVGYNFGTVINCTSSATVSGKSYAGGIVGYNNRDNNSQAFVINCTNTGAVSGTTQIGGIVGYNYGDISGCSNSGSVTASSDYVGGITGYNITKSGLANGLVTNCYNTGTIKGSAGAVGGIVGDNLAVVQYSVNKSTSISGNTNVGGVVGRNVNNGSVQYVCNVGTATAVVGGTSSAVNSVLGWTFVTSAKTGKADTGYYVVNLVGATVKPTTEDGTWFDDWADITTNNFTGFYVENVTIENDKYFGLFKGDTEVQPSAISTTTNGDGMPVVEYAQLNVIPVGDLTIKLADLEFGRDWTLSGTWGSASNPYYIRNATHLKNLADILAGTKAVIQSNSDREYYGKFFEVTQNITGVTTAIGSRANGFRGTFDGKEYTITVNISTTESDCLGLFACIGNNAVVKNLKVTGKVSGLSNVGGIIGFNNGATVQNCHVTNITVTGTSINIAGIVAFNNGGTVKDCTATAATINCGSNNAGGIVANNYKAIATIQNCEATATVIATGSRSGGIAGYNEGTILDCTNNSTSLDATNYIGGIVGGNLGIVQNCVNDASINAGAKNYVGGIAGGNSVNTTDSANLLKGTIQNCINNGSITSTNTGVGGIAGINQGATVNGEPFNATISGSKNTESATINGKTRVGGIVGESAGTITNSVNYGAATCTDHSVGGIVGRFIGGTVQYSVNFGTISGGISVGGVIGYMENGTGQYLFNFGELNGTNFGSVSSGARQMTGVWAFATARPAGAQASSQSRGYYFIAEQSILDKVKPMVGTTVNGDWTWDDILTHNFDGFAIAGLTVNNGKYLSLQMGNGFATPSNTITSTANADGSVVFGDIHYGAVNGTPYGASADITVQILDIALQDIDGSFELQTDYNPSTANVIDMIYDGRDKLTLIESFIAGGNVCGYSSVVTADSATIIESNGTKLVRAEAHNAGANGVVFGQFVQKVQIKAFDFNADYAQYYYNGLVYGDVEKYNYDGVVLSNITNGAVIAHSDKDSTDNKKFYVMRKLDNGEMVCVITFDYETLSSNIVREFVYGTDPMEFTFTHYAPVSVEQAGVITGVSEGSTKFTGSFNFAGTRTINYVIVASDFGKLGQSEKAWGTEENPYVISHWAHLVRLSEIVNGTSEPIDSVMGAEYASNVIANDIFFSSFRKNNRTYQCHFVVTNNITLPEGVEFAPIGGAQVNVTDANNESVTLSYFGGNFTGRYNGQTATIDLGNALKDAHDMDYVGLFGVVKGKVLNGTTYWATIDNVLVTATEINGKNYVGSLIAKAEQYVYIDNSATPYQNTATVSGVSHVGGVVGYVGLGTQMFGTFVNKGTIVATGQYTGGIIGRLMAGAGRQGTGTGANNYYFGEPNNGKTLSLDNQGTIDATDSEYVGGIIGGLTANEGDYSGVTTVLTVNYVRNTASVWGGNYVGGWFGEVGTNVAVHVINGAGTKAQNQWSYNGSMSSNVYDSTEKLNYTISGTDYVGGLVGKLSAMGHQLTGVFNTMEVIGYGANIGGLIGVMDSGTLTNCFVSLPDKETITTETSMVKGADNVGGLIGMMNAGTLKDSYAQGFDYSTVTANRGGVAGVAQAVATISNTWALYVTGTSETVTYKTTARNSYGKYILTYSGNAMSTIDEMLVFAGLMQDSDIADGYRRATTKIAGEKSKIALGITLPETTKKNIQLTFYDASGYESPFLYPFDGAVNDSTTSAGMLYIRLGSGAGSSIIIAATPVRFGSVANYGSTTAWADAYINIGTAGLYKADVLSASNSSDISVSYQTMYSYDYSATGNYVIISRVVSKTLSQGDEEAPYIIASTADWNTFATNLTNYAGKHVKLANDITVTTLAGTTDGNKYFTGTFDGDGYTITIDGNASSGGVQSLDAGHNAGYSLFPGARNATFKNLTVAGTITNAGGNTAGFVGRAYGSLTFENCTNKVNISKTNDEKGSGYSIGGFIGTTAMTKEVADGKSYTFIACVNQGNISVFDRVGQITYAQRSQRDPETHGVGGFIGTAWNGDLTITYNNPMDTDGVGGSKGDGEPKYENGFSNVCGTTPKVIMESCRNAANVLGSYNVGGLVGYNSCATEVMNCGNTGKIEAIGEGTSASESTKMNRDSRTYILTEVTSGVFGGNQKRVYIRRYLNAGGLVGLSTSKGHVDMYTSYNSGEIHAWGNNAGGLIASDTEYTKVKPTQATKIYYCYNTGAVITGGDKYTVFHGYNSDYTDRYDANNGSNYTDDQRYLKSVNGPVAIDDTSKTKQSLDHYEMSIRHEDNIENVGDTREGGAFGVQVGGIIGATTNTDINYCYNIGTITCRGLATFTFKGNFSVIKTTYTEYHARAGGIVGYVDSGEVSVQNSYSVGDIKLEARHAITGTWGIDQWITQLNDFKQQRPMYVAGIVGHHNTVKDLSSKVKNCFSIKWQCHYLNDDNKWERYHIEGYNPVGELIQDWQTNHLKFVLGQELPVRDEHSSSGHVVSSVAQLTGITNANGEVTMPAGETYSAADPEKLNQGVKINYTVPSATTMNHTNANGLSDVRALLNGSEAIKGASVSGWIYMPGCLPQLSVFAVDTQDGLAMTSVGYGRNTMGEFVQQPAGSEFNPYIIKDGVDLLGLSSLVGANGFNRNFSFEGKYIEFANGTNNLRGDTTSSIKMPTLSYQRSDGSNCSDYVFLDNGTVKEGKSYQLYNRAANGLHGVKSNSSDKSQVSTRPATSIRATAQSSGDYSPLNTDKLDSAYTTWSKKHYAYNGTSMTTGVLFDVHNFNPIGYQGENGSDRSFKGNISGHIKTNDNGTIVQTEIAGLKVSQSAGETANTYAGLFGLVKNATIEHITVTGNVTGYNISGGTAQAGIVAKAYGNNTLRGLKAGTKDAQLVVKTSAGNAGYVGGIVGMGDSGATGNRLLIESCDVRNADISSHKYGVGGIIGYTQGDNAASFTDINRCTVTIANIYSTNGHSVGGIIGTQGAAGAVSVHTSQVGRSDKQGSVTISGERALGGIIAYADASSTCANSYVDCRVYSNVTIKRTGATNAGEYGTAIGGIVGAILDNTGGYATFSGRVEFQGTIDLGTYTNNKNVGGVVGYMGTTARMEESEVIIGGTINIAEGGAGENIGGFAGVSKGVCLDGLFFIYPTLNTFNSDNVGGFIGYNDGDTYITRTANIYTGVAVNGLISGIENVSGTIVADTNVGGFIGSNADGKILHVGTEEYAGTTYGTENDKAIIDLGSSVDGRANVGGFLGYNGGYFLGEYCTVVNEGTVGSADASMGNADDYTEYVGGVIGYATQASTIYISSNASIENSGQVGHSNFKASYQQFVGGIIGASFGTVYIEAASAKQGKLANKGNVYGYEYVGGAIGAIGAGTISGDLDNGIAPEDSATSSAYVGSEALASSDIQALAEMGGASVTAVRSVGGVIGVVMADATISWAVMDNYGTVVADSVGVDGTDYVSNLGGVIGLHYGIIEDSQFYNHGAVTAENFAGGAIGVSDGVITGSSFINYANITFNGDTALGGAVGYITNDYNGITAQNSSYVEDSYFSYKPEIASGEGLEAEKVIVQATGANAYTGSVVKGGLGGVFGVIDSTDITADNWKGNDFFIHGDILGGTGKPSESNFVGTVESVGGVVGIIAGAHVTINNMLVYKSTVAGANYVGGIIGSNGSANHNDGDSATASVDNCYNVYGEVVAKNASGKVGQAGGLVGSVIRVDSNGNIERIDGIAEGTELEVDENGNTTINTHGNSLPLTHKSYWVKEHDNEYLQNADPTDMSTIEKAGSWQCVLTAGQFESNVDIGDDGVFDEGSVHGSYNAEEGEEAPLYNPDYDGYFRNCEVDGCTQCAEYAKDEWTDYLETNAEGRTVLVIDGQECIQNNNGDWGYYAGEATVDYNTGTPATGYYFIFTKDEEFDYAEAPIAVDHSNSGAPLTSPYEDETLNFWLIIANSYDKAYAEYESDQVIADGGVVKAGYVYANAYASNKNGFYLYMGATNDKSVALKQNGTKVYIKANAENAGNVMIFYKEFSSTRELEYNGFERYAPADSLEYSASTAGEKSDFGTYFYTLNGTSGVNRGKNAGSYHTVATIWTVDNDGKTIIMGSVDSRNAEDDKYKWTISKRDISVEYGGKNAGGTFGTVDVPAITHVNDDNLYNGTFLHYVTVTASNMVIDESKQGVAGGANATSQAVKDALSTIVNVKYEYKAFDGKTSSGTIDKADIIHSFDTDEEILENYKDATSDILVVAYYVTRSKGVGINTDFTVDNSKTQNAETYEIEYRVYARNAGTYKVTLFTSDANHEIKKTQGYKDLIIGRKEITLDFAVDDRTPASKYGSLDSGYIFDGGAEYRGVQSIEINGISSYDIKNLNKILTANMTRTSNVSTKQTVFYEIKNGVLYFYSSDVGTYEASLALEKDYINNYYFVAGDDACGSLTETSWNEDWVISPYQISIGENVVVEGKTVIYNGEKHSITYSGFDSSIKNGIYQETGWVESVRISVDFGGAAIGEQVNVGRWVISSVDIDNSSFTGEVNGRANSKAQSSDPIDNYVLSGSVASGSEAVLEILPREVRMVWNGNPTTSFVYNGSAQGFNGSAVALQINMKETPGDSDNWVEAGTLTLSGNTLTVSGILEHQSATGKVSETLTFDVSNFTATNAGTYTATIGAEIKSATGKNDGGDTLKTNYDYDNSEVEDGKTYTIAKSRITLTFNSQAVNGKEFDNKTTVTAALPGFTLSSSNGGSIPATSAINIDSKDYAKNGVLVKNVGTGYDVQVKYSLNSSFSNNFELVDSGVATLRANAAITAKGITVILNTASGTNTVYKTFDNSTLYAEVNSNGSKTVSSSGMKPGRGITVEGFLTSGVTVTAVFQESDRTRSQFDEYVNNVKVDRSVYSMTTGFYKQLYIRLSNNSGDNQAGNYYIKEVRNKAGEVVVSGSGTEIVVMDSRQDGTTSQVNMAIAITPYSIKVSYGGTTQSYANADNTYNTNWNPVVCSDNKIPDSWHFTADNLKVEVSNGWMTANGGVYKKYTRIAGKAGNSTLGAKLTSDKGYNFCVTLRNQPTLIIGYFVEKPEGNAIGTMAGLLIATEYYKGNFVPEGATSYDYFETVIDVKTVDSKYNTWEELLQDIDFDFTTTDIYKDLLAQYNATSDADMKEVLLSQLESFEFTLVEDKLQLVYWKAEEIADTRKFTSFYLINNIDAVMTEMDMEMIKGAFGANWGAGKTHLSNVIFAEVGSAVIFNGSVFDYTLDEEGNKIAFNGQFDGYGYTIDHLTITHTVKGTDEEVNVGMFSEVSGLGSKVTAINFRNLGIYVTDNTGMAGRVINVGAVAGKYAGAQVMKDVTVHGTISVKSSSAEVYVGGVLGRDGTGYEDGGISSVLEGAIVVATIRAEGKVAVAGGIVGIMTEYNTSMTNLVSLSEVYAKGETAIANGFVGRYKGMVGGSVQMTDGINYTPITTEGKESAFMDSVFTISVDGVYTKVNGGGKTYTELYDGSMTAFNASGKYTTPVTSNAYGKYDVVGEKNAFAEANTTGTMRLKDIVDIYVLGYGLSKTTATVEGATVNTYQKSNTSKYFHASGAPTESPAYKPDGTTDNPIKIAYQQHLSLLRMFNFMNFTVTNDITMYTGYNLALVDEAFTGTVNADGKSINVRSADKLEGANAVMFAYQPQSFTWLVID